MSLNKRQIISNAKLKIVMVEKTSLGDTNMYLSITSLDMRRYLNEIKVEL